MLGPVPVILYPGDEGAALAYGKDVLVNHNIMLDSLTWTNKGAAAAYIQIFNTARRYQAPITNTNNATGVITATAHGYVTGDKVTFAGITGLTTHYVNAASADTLTVYSTRALALAGGTPDVLPTNNGETGTFSLASDAASAPIPEEYPVLGVGSAPSNVGSYTAARFSRGFYARAVTAAGGSTLVAADDIKFTVRYSSGPIMGGTYED